jgi:hypothetical protein
MTVCQVTGPIKLASNTRRPETAGDQYTLGGVEITGVLAALPRIAPQGSRRRRKGNRRTFVDVVLRRDKIGRTAAPPRRSYQQ